MADEVQSLRNFRDRFLATNSPGRKFISFYYRVSPPIADAIRPHDSARFMVWVALWPLVLVVNHPAGVLGAVVIFAGGIAFVRRRRPAEL
jgi:hypothetical protein